MAAWTDETAEEVAGLIEPGDVVMIKASRAMGLERIAAAIQRRFS